jgi:exopolysaccharide biosynthesis operon protein EpsL
MGQIPADGLLSAFLRLVYRLFTMAEPSPMLKYGLSLCLLSLCPAAAHAMADPSDIFLPYVSNTVTYIDNLFYQNSLAPHSLVDPATGNKRIKDDIMNQATVGSAVNYALGRQLFKLSLSVTDNRFVNNQFMDNVSSNDRAAWNWQLGRGLSGDVGYAYTRAMGGFANTSFYGLNIITSNNAFANLNYAWHPRWKARTSLNWLEYTNSASQRQANNQQIATALIGLNYTTPSNNSTGLEYSYTDGKYPNRQQVLSTLSDNKYRQHSVNGLLTWKITEKTRFNGNVGYTIRQNPDPGFSRRDFNGPTFNLTLSWTPTAKIMLSLSGFRQLNSYADVTDNFVIVEGFSVSPMWQLSPKLALTTKFTRQTWDYSGDPGILTTTTLSHRHDTIMNGQASLVYTPVPNAEITLGYQGAKRDSVNPTNYPYDYNVNSVFCSGMLKF